MELFIRKKEQNINLSPPITLANNTPPLTSEAYADDVICVIPATHACLVELTELITNFGNCTNLMINKSKTEVMIIGATYLNAIESANNLGYKVFKEITHLGIVLDHKVTNLSNNWDKKIKKNPNS